MFCATILDFSSLARILVAMDNIGDLDALTDEALLERAIHSPSAFEVLVMRYQKDFLQRATFVVKSRDEAEDIVQDAFVRIYRFAPRFNAAHGTFRAWAMTILMNVARTKYQKQAKEWDRTAALEPEHYESLAAPEEDEEVGIARDTITRALDHAPPDVAALLKLAFIDGLPYEEIAQKEGITVGAVKTRVHRAKKVLKKIIIELET